MVSNKNKLEYKLGKILLGELLQGREGCVCVCMLEGGGIIKQGECPHCDICKHLKGKAKGFSCFVLFCFNREK